MYRKIRITVVSLVVMTICMLSSTATLSYFTDTDSATNEFTVGKAASSLSIYEDENSITPFGTTNIGPLTDNMPDIAYYLQATNTGNIPVYQRFRVVIPGALANAITLEIPNCTLVADVNNTNISTCSNSDYSVTYDSSVPVDNATYAVYYIVSNVVLGLNEKTANWPTSAIKVGTVSTVTDLQDITTCTTNDSNNCKFGIRAYSDVIQTTGFTSAVQAFDGFAETY